ncbi:MAG: carboxypeptidase-like regulatory domain-containing protein [Bacteroidota bacterium]
MNQRVLLWGLVALFVGLSGRSLGQAKPEEPHLIQFSGVVLDKDSLIPIAFTSVMIKNSYRGTISDMYGYFSLVMESKDTIVFSNIGYQGAAYIIPDSLNSNRYSLIQLLSRDTFELEEALVYPWPTREQFKEAFLNLRIPLDDYDRAARNLAMAAMREQGLATPLSGRANYNYEMQRYTSKLYYAGQAPPISLLNPVAWARFIESWKAGELRNKDQ